MKYSDFIGTICMFRYIKWKDFKGVINPIEHFRQKMTQSGTEPNFRTRVAIAPGQNKGSL